MAAVQLRQARSRYSDRGNAFFAQRSLFFSSWNVANVCLAAQPLCPLESDEGP